MDPVEKLKYQTIQTELRDRLGLCNVFRRFLQNYAPFSAPLNKKFRKNQTKEFGSQNKEESNDPAYTLTKTGRRK